MISIFVKPITKIKILHMKNSKLYLVLLMVSVTLFLYSCDSVTDSAQQNDIQSQGLTTDSNARKAKVDVCHLDDEGNYKLLSIAGPALQAHLDHGDGVPGGDVPDMEGYQFDETCTPEPVVVEVVEITACFTTVKGNLISPNLEDVVFEDLEWSPKTDDGNIFAIDSPFLGGILTLQTRQDANLCGVGFVSSTSNQTAAGSVSSDLAGDRSYLEYLLSL
jgi:hypothetical protein